MTCKYCHDVVFDHHECVASLRAQLEAEKIKRVNEYADAGRVINWVNNSCKPPANTHFTEGPERQIAYAIEKALEAAQAREKELVKAVADHVTVRGEYYDRITKAEQSLAAAMEREKEYRIEADGAAALRREARP